MVALPVSRAFTPREYLTLEREAETKSEFYDGIITAMSGASPTHNDIVYNVTLALGPKLRGMGCRGYISDQRVRVKRGNGCFYPDFIAYCGSPRYESLTGLQSLLNPLLIVEVLSPSTEGFDRVVKFDYYRRIESLSTYVLIVQDRPRVEVFTRQSEGEWRHQVAEGLDDVLFIEALGCELRLVEIYADVTFAESDFEADPNA